LPEGLGKIQLMVCLQGVPEAITLAAIHRGSFHEGSKKVNIKEDSAGNGVGGMTSF